VDVETTGTVFGHHEIIQIAAVPLDHHMKPSKEHKFLYMNMAPKHPERQGVGAKSKHGLDAFKFAETYISQEKGADIFNEWFTSLNLPFGKRLVPLAHNWAFERGFLSHWLGVDLLDQIWHPFPRDTMIFANMVNDIYAWQGLNPPFHSITLVSLCNRFQIPLEDAHDALADSIATGSLYREMIRSFG
jgi:DNA polymerase III alpha subunit (gram-positive type)